MVEELNLFNVLPTPMVIPTENLVEVVIRLLVGAQKQIDRDITKNPKRYLEKIILKSTGKPALCVDSDAENSFERKLSSEANHIGEIKFYGEESLTDKTLDLTDRKGLVALADIVDGSDLLERDLGNWCSALTIFAPTAPRGKRIRACFIALPPVGAKVYVACDDQPGVRLKLSLEDIRPVAGPSRVRRLTDASICFYGQKPNNLTETVSRLARPKLRSCSDLRIYNLAGMPMMAKLVDHWVRNASGIDAVFDVKGQQPHDVVPGLYMAIKAGCAVRNLDGHELTIETLEDSLLKPTSSRISYVAAATEELCDELLEVLQPFRASNDTGELDFRTS